MPSNSQSTSEFFEALLPAELDEDENLSLVFLSGGKTALHRCDNGADAAATVEKMSGWNAFVGISTVSNNCSGRGKEIDTVSCLSFVLDLDVKKGSFSSKDDAMDFLTKLPVRPTIIADSGSGIHAWYMFQEPWRFENGEERIEAKTLSRRFWTTANRIARGRGCKLDSTFDLSRIMRVPGSINTKRSLATAVVKSEPNRYDPGDFEDWTIPADECIGHDVQGGSYDFDLKKVKLGTPENWDLISQADPGIADLVFHRRKFPSGDDSLSSYDLAIASKMRHGGLTDQICVEVMIWHRMMHKGKTKAPQYYRRTMARVNETVAQGLPDPLKSIPAIMEDGSEAPKEAQTQFKRQYGFELNKVELYEGDDGEEEFIVQITGRDGSATRAVKSLDILMRPTLWKKIWMTHGEGPQCKISGKMWNEIFLPIIKEKMTRMDYDNPVATRMPKYLGTVIIGGHVRPEDLYSYVREGNPFHMDGVLYVNLQHLSDFIWRSGRGIPMSSLMRWMRKIGFERTPYKMGGGRTMDLWAKGELERDKIFDGVLALADVNFDIGDAN